MSDDRPRAVFNCTVFARALINPKGPAGACLAHAQQGELILVISDYILQEIRELPEKIKPQRGVTPERVELLIRDLAKYSEPIENVLEHFVHPDDPDDSHYVNLAHAARCKLILSNDRHLLELAEASKPLGQAFARQFPDLQVLSPEEFLHTRRQKQQPAQKPAADPSGPDTDVR